MQAQVSAVLVFQVLQRFLVQRFLPARPPLLEKEGWTTTSNNNLQFSTGGECWTPAILHANQHFCRSSIRSDSRCSGAASIFQGVRLRLFWSPHCYCTSRIGV